MTRANAAPKLIALPISSPCPWFSGCRQLAWKGWDRGRGNRRQGHIRSGPRSCHWQKRRNRKRCRRRRDGPGTWLSFGTAQGIDSITSVPFGGKENFADASPRVPDRGPRRASLSLARRPPPSGTVVHCGCAGVRKGRGRQTFCIGLQFVKPGSRPNLLQSAALVSRCTKLQARKTRSLDPPLFVKVSTVPAMLKIASVSADIILRKRNQEIEMRFKNVAIFILQNLADGTRRQFAVSDPRVKA
jgi:hypothetical protein